MFRCSPWMSSLFATEISARKVRLLVLISGRIWNFPTAALPRRLKSTGAKIGGKFAVYKRVRFLKLEKARQKTNANLRVKRLRLYIPTKKNVPCQVVTSAGSWGPRSYSRCTSYKLPPSLKDHHIKKVCWTSRSDQYQQWTTVKFGRIFLNTCISQRVYV